MLILAGETRRFPGFSAMTLQRSAANALLPLTNGVLVGNAGAGGVGDSADSSDAALSLWADLDGCCEARWQIRFAKTLASGHPLRQTRGVQVDRTFSDQVTPDILAPGLEALFIGINPGLVSAQKGHNFANPGNAFWRLMHESGLVPKRLRPEEEMELLQYGLGLTNLVARATRGVNDLGPDDYAAGRKLLATKIRRYAPRRLVFVGITVCRSFFEKKASEPIACGAFLERVQGAAVFVVPNPSGRNAHFSYAEMLEAFQFVARAMGRG